MSRKKKQREEADSKKFTFLQTKKQRHQEEKCLKQHSSVAPTLLVALFVKFTALSNLRQLSPVSKIKILH